MKNPFKLLGSYVGLFLGLIASYFSFAIVLSLAESGKFILIALLIPFIPIILGFLLGWLIHLLILKLK